MAEQMVASSSDPAILWAWELSASFTERGCRRPIIRPRLRSAVTPRPSPTAEENLMTQASSGSSAGEALVMVAICGIAIPGPAESLSVGGCMVVLPLKPTRDALASTLSCPPAPMVGVIKAPSLHLPREARSVRVSDSGMRPDKDMHLEAGLMVVTSAQTRASQMAATPGFRLLVEDRTDVSQLVAVKASDPRGAFARRDLSYTEDRAVVALLLRAVKVVAVGEA